jgi:hypothetical protein
MASLVSRLEMRSATCLDDGQKYKPGLYGSRAEECGNSPTCLLSIRRFMTFSSISS